MNVVSFWCPRPEHPFFRDYIPFLDLLRLSCERFGHQHVCLTDDPTVADGYVVPELPRSLMKAFIAAQYAYLSDPANANTPTLLTGADCVLAVNPAFTLEAALGLNDPPPDLLITTDDRFTDCRMNMGAMWVPRPAAVAHVWADALVTMGDEWGDDQRAVYAALLRSDLLVREYPCDHYNRAPDHPGHDCTDATVLHFRGPRKDWMAAYCHHWLGLGDGVQIKMAPNTDDAVGIAQLKANVAADPACLEQIEAHNEVAVIVGSGPSAEDDLPLIREMAAAGATVFALNGAARWLIQNGLTPQLGVLLDMREGNLRFVEGVEPTDGWLMASHCHPAVVAAGYYVGLYHHGVEAYHPHLPQGATLIGGGPTVGITAMYLACVLGFRRLHLFGYDSSFRGAQTHLLPQPINDAESVVFDVHVGAQSFHTNAGMYAQAGAFEPACAVLHEGIPDLEISVHGDGLLPAIAHQMNAAAAATAALAA